MRLQLKYLKLSPIELLGLIFIALAALAVVDGRALLAYYGLTSSGQALHDGAAQTVTAGLKWLDSLRLTDQLVTFIVWASVGLLCLSLIRAIGGAYGELQRDRQLSSSQYVHPTTFSKSRLWRQIIVEAIVLFLVLLLSVISVCSFVAFAAPTAAAYSQSFLLGFKISEIGNLLIGIAVMYVWLVLLWLCGRALIHHHQLVRAS